MSTDSTNLQELQDRITQLEAELKNEKDERKKRDLSFQKIEQRLNRLLENYPNGMVNVFDTKYRYLFVDGAELAKLGYKKEELLGRTLTEVFPRDLAFHIMRFLDGVWKDNKIEFEYELKNETYLVAAAPLRNSEGIINQMIVITQNITELKKIEQRAKESEERYRALFEKSSDPTLLIEDGRFVECNDATLTYLGYENKNEIVGQYPHDLSPTHQPDGQSSIEKAEVMIKNALQLGNARFEWKHTKKDGSEVWVDVALTHIKSDGKDRLYTVWRDISNQKEAYKALRESENRFKQFMNHIPAGIFMKDDEGRYLFINKFSEKRFGLKDWHGKKVDDFFGKKEVEQFRKDDAEVLQKGQLSKITNIIDKTGKKNYFTTRYFRIDNEDGTSLVAGVSVDETEQVLAKKKLEESEEKNRAFSEATKEGLVFSENGYCIEANKAAAEMFGYRVEEMKGLFGTDFIAEESKEKVERNMLSGYKKPYEAMAIRKDGTKFWAEFEGKNYEYKGGKVRATAVRDVTERKKFIAELEKSEENFKNLFENAALGVFKSIPDGKYELVNDTFANILGYNSADEMVKKVNDISKLYKNPKDRDKIEDIFAKQGFVKDYEILANHPKKDLVWISINASAQLGPDGEVYYEGTIQDITDRKIAEELIREKVVELQKFNKLLVGRELQMIELKKEVNELCEKFNLPKKYSTPDKLNDKNKDRV